MRNPFHFGAPLEERSAFADRRSELRQVVDLMLGGQNVILLSPRRYGKTSLLLRCIEDVRRRGGRTGYANLARCTSRREVAEELLRATLDGPMGWLRRRGQAIREHLAHLRISPELTFTADGTPLVRFSGTRTEEAWDELLADVLRTLRHLHDADHPVSLVIDEFQQIAEIPPGLGGLFKSLADELRVVSLVMSGSAEHLMRALTHGPGAPLYGMGETIDLPVVPEADMVDHLCRRSRGAGRPMDLEVARMVFRRAGPVPNDVQRLAYTSFSLADTEVTAACVEEAMAVIVTHQSGDFARRFEQLASARTQQRVLRTLAAEPTGQPFTRSFMLAVEAGSSTGVRKALHALERREAIARRGGVWQVADPFFREWLVRPGVR